MFPKALRRDIIAILAIKAVLLAALYFLFFSPSHRVDAGPARLQAHLFEDRSS